MLRAFSLLLGLLLSPLSTAGGEPSMVTGSVAYRERIALTPEAAMAAVDGSST